MPADRTATARPARRTALPVVTIATVGATALVTVLSRRAGSGLRPALERDPGALSGGHWWRVVSPVLVQTDPEVWQLLGTWSLAAFVGVFTEGHLGHLRAALAFVAGAVAGNAAGYAWQLSGGGISVAAFGQLGALAPWFLRAGPRPARVAGAVILAAAVADLVAWHDHHGAAALAGALAGVWLTRGLPPVDDRR